jgi:hypothetical protein
MLHHLVVEVSENYEKKEIIIPNLLEKRLKKC